MRKKKVCMLIVLELVIIILGLTLLSATLCTQTKHIKPDSNYVVPGYVLDQCVEWKARTIFSEAKIDTLLDTWPVVNRKEKWYYYGAGILTVIGIKYGLKLLK